MNSVSEETARFPAVSDINKSYAEICTDVMNANNVISESEIQMTRIYEISKNSFKMNQYSFF